MFAVKEVKAGERKFANAFEAEWNRTGYDYSPLWHMLDNETVLPVENHEQREVETAWYL